MGFGKNGTGAILRSQEEIVLSTLGDITAIKFLSDITIKEDFRVLRQDIFSHITGLTAGEGFGLMLGIANGELSVAEIAGCLLTDGPTDRNDRGKIETAERNVVLLSEIEPVLSGVTEQFHGENGGPKITSKHRWTYSNPEGWDFFIWNHSGAALTTGATARLIQTTYGLWVT